jgi:hypothetical protein
MSKWASNLYNVVLNPLMHVSTGCINVIDKKSYVYHLGSTNKSGNVAFKKSMTISIQFCTLSRCQIICLHSRLHSMILHTLSKI